MRGAIIVLSIHPFTYLHQGYILFFNNIIYLLDTWGFHIMFSNSTHFLVPSCLLLTLAVFPTKDILKLKSNKAKQKPLQSFGFATSLALFIHPSAIGSQMCYTVYLFVQSALLENVHGNESLVWFMASGFWYTNITGLSLILLFGILWLPHRDAAGIVPQTNPFTGVTGHKWSRC